MNTTEGNATRVKDHVLNAISWIFGVVYFAAGIINVFWGNDPAFGVFIVLLSLVYFPPITSLFTEKTRVTIPGISKIFLAVVIVWMTLGVGELFEKIDMMLYSFGY